MDLLLVPLACKDAYEYGTKGTNYPWLAKVLVTLHESCYETALCMHIKSGPHSAIQSNEIQIAFHWWADSGSRLYMFAGW